MKLDSAFFLKVVILLTAITALAGMILIPPTEGRAVELDLLSIYSDPFLIYLYVASMPFFVALWQAFKLAGYLDKNLIFTQAAVRSIAKIKMCALLFTGFMLVAILFIFVNSKATNDDGAGAIVVGLVVTFASGVITTASTVFQKLLQNAIDIKTENDLII
jgi:hypothetical protein